MPTGPHFFPNSTSISLRSPSEYDFYIPVVDIFTLDTEVLIPRDADSPSPTTALVRAGYLGHVPHAPSLAFSLHTLEHFRLLRARKPSFSIEAFGKVLCDSYKIPYRRRYRTCLSGAFDTYLAILRGVDRKINETLGRDAPNWRVLNACPPCTYELEGEPTLTFGRMYVLDGGNSAKRMAEGARNCGDMRQYTESDYILPALTLTTDEDADADPSRHTIASDCSKNWKAAASDEKKRMWSIFDETGIFVSACRHGLVLWVADMVRSGELAKYPLAIISKVLELLGERSLAAYDIGCGFASTIRASSLGKAFEQQGCRICVDAFHGYAHNYACQTKNHPNGIQGAGIEDFGAIKRFFSASNALAPVIRYATAYRRSVFLDLFFKQWDDDKYLNLATMIYHNYKQSINIIASESLALDGAKASLGIQDGDLEAWRQEEIEYIAGLGKETTWDIHAMAYVKLLHKLRDAQTCASDASLQFLSTMPSDYQFLSPSQDMSYSANVSATRKLETQRRYHSERLDTLQHEVVALEVKMGITHRWQPTSPEYQETMKYMAMHTYQRALDNLQRLVVQRLFELQKLNISQTAYKMRTHISKSLQTRCHAIQTAIKKYNEAASQLHPPRPPLEWSKVSHYSFLEEFNLLRETQQDIRDKMWAKPAIRETMRQWLRIQRAKEEIERCNVEVRRLHTSIVDEDRHFTRVLSSLEDSPLYFAVQEFCTHRRLVNSQLLDRIFQIYALPGFSGVASPGLRKGRVDLDGEGDGMDGILVGHEHEHDRDGDDETIEALDDEGDDMQDIGTLVEYLSDLALTH
ncbi:uncharacterized protein HD556DRAFT_1435133 [Suillus plorans]|uniref:CxC1-like cysteine cluster associated with KDZ transposases domain-containing protein n=1 Tax=Suillus plorans TaxID=116603 RepID=A0A9P7AC96_9AGAM|nr:uncharacterized protein HD556DRAFT_1435133 [Suillus plorans]KAG1785411.1 hypothetical protein HD556DRAFT_1435133 [Suillus plorans]